MFYKLSKLLLIGAAALFLGGCNLATYVKVIVTAFSDDPQFNNTLDANKLTKIDNLWFYWPTTTSLTLQCLATNGVWTSIQSPTRGPLSTLARNPDNSFQNVNKPGYAPINVHTWPGALLQQQVSSCAVTVANVSVTSTPYWVYTHKQKSLQLRVVDNNSNVLAVFNDAEWACFYADTAPDHLTRANHCNNTTNDTSFQQPFDEEITRVSNLGTLSLEFNANWRDAWVCSYRVAVDGVDDGVIYGNNSVLGSPVRSNFFSKKVVKGNHTIAFTNVPNCFATKRLNDGFCSPPYPASSCTANTTTTPFAPYDIPMTMESTPAQVITINVLY
jgi:hypothetical protein